jgi:hypothetical protein
MREGKEPLRTFGDLKQFLSTREEAEEAPQVGTADAEASHDTTEQPRQADAATGDAAATGKKSRDEDDAAAGTPPSA